MTKDEKWNIIKFMDKNADMTVGELLVKYADQQTKELQKEVERFEEYYSSTKIHIEKQDNLIEKQRKEIEEQSNSLNVVIDNLADELAYKHIENNLLKAEAKEKEEIIKEFNLILLDEYPHLSTKNLNKYRKAVDKRNKLLNN